MARNRRRAKDRKQKLHRENVPGSLDHASGEVDQVEAAIVAGAGGKPVEPAPADVADEPVDAVDQADPVDPVEPDDAVEPADAVQPAPKRRRGRKPVVADERVEPLDPVDVDEEPVDLDETDVEREPYSDRELDADAAAVEHGRLGKGAGDVALPPDAHKPAGFRLTNFIRACWAELQRVDWPDRRQVGQGSAVVLGFVVVAGAFLGLADVVAQRIVDFIL